VPTQPNLPNEKMPTEDDEIIGEICDYAEQYQIKAMLQEYLRRIVLAKPDQPIHFLKETIKENPFVVPAPQAPAATSTEDAVEEQQS
jgi:hypothetical protein